MPVDSPLSSLLRESHDWRADYDDGLAILFARIGMASAKARDQGRDSFYRALKRFFPRMNAGAPTKVCRLAAPTERG